MDTSERRPRLIVIAGPNGAGKTSLTAKLLGHPWAEGCEYINPDTIAKDVFGSWNDPDAIMKAAEEAERRRYQYLAEGKEMVVETILSSPEKLSFLRKAKAAGYFIRLFFVGTDSPEINAGRVARRFMNGGHDVPIPKIVGRYPKSIANGCLAAAIADRAYIYDNSIDMAEIKLLFRSVDGEVHRVYADPRPWAEMIFDCLVSLRTEKAPLWQGQKSAPGDDGSPLR